MEVLLLQHKLAKSEGHVCRCMMHASCSYSCGTAGTRTEWTGGLTAEGMVPFHSPATPSCLMTFLMTCRGPMVEQDCSRVFSSSMGLVMRVAMAPLADPAATFLRTVGSVSAPNAVFSGAYMPRRRPAYTGSSQSVTHVTAHIAFLCTHKGKFSCIDPSTNACSSTLHDNATTTCRKGRGSAPLEICMTCSSLPIALSPAQAASM